MEQAPDRKRVQEFARRLFGHYTSGMLTLMVDIGHRTGLFEAAANGVGTSQQIADRAGLDERYVREWLGTMATGGIIEYDARSQTFVLPAEHAVCLTGASSRNLAANSQSLAMLAKRLAAVTACFRSGGGVPYSQFRPDFTEFMDASWRLLYDGLLIKGFVPAVKGLPERLAAGIRVADLGWNRARDQRHGEGISSLRLCRIRHRRRRDCPSPRRSASDGLAERAIRGPRRDPSPG